MRRLGRGSMIRGLSQNVVRQGIGILASRLDPVRFLEVHRSEIVNVQAVVRLEPWRHGAPYSFCRTE